MNRKPTTQYGLEPREAQPFTKRQRRYDRQRAQYDPSIHPLPAAFDVPQLVSPVAVAAIRRAFTLAKTSRDAWQSYKREGRLDFRQAPRADRGAQDIFKRRTGSSTTKVRCAVLIDASGSMGGTDARIEHPDYPGETIQVSRSMAAAVFGGTIAKALGGVPTIALDVFQHAAGGHHGSLNLKWRWAKGTPVAVFNENIYGIGGGANADGHALYAITERMLRELKRGERGVIMVVSDGLPSAYAPGGTSNAGQALIDAVAHARARGITVIGVAIDGSDQSVYYGEKGTVPFTGSWMALGSALAKVVGSALAVR